MPPTIPDMPIPTDPAQLIGYLATHNWYAIAAVALMIGLQLVKTHANDWWNSTAVGYRFLWPILIAAVTGFIHGFVTGATVNGALWAALNALWQIALPAMGGAAALKESPLPWSGGRGGVPKSETAPEPPVPVLAPEPPEDDRPTPVDPRPPAPSEPPPPMAA